MIEKRFAPRHLEQSENIFTLADGYTGIRGAFEKGRPAFQNGTFINGNVAAELSLAGKPEPDTFLEAARRLDADPSRAVVVEDALSGVQAGKRGGFGLVMGVARNTSPDELRHNGADVVVSDLGDLLPSEDPA